MADSRRHQEPRYQVGQEVLLSSEAGHAVRPADMAQRGVIDRQPDHRQLGYIVWFPGKYGQLQVSAAALLPAPPFPVIRLGERRLIRSLASAKDALVQTAARIRLHEASGRQPRRLDILDRNTLAAALDQRCHLPGGQMLGQLGPEIAALTLAFLCHDASAVDLTGIGRPAQLARQDLGALTAWQHLPVRRAAELSRSPLAVRHVHALGHHRGRSS
jgi:hypothetical protein